MTGTLPTEDSMLDRTLRETDPEIAEALDHEAQRQHRGLELRRQHACR